MDHFIRSIDGPATDIFTIQRGVVAIDGGVVVEKVVWNRSGRKEEGKNLLVVLITPCFLSTLLFEVPVFSGKKRIGVLRTFPENCIHYVLSMMVSKYMRGCDRFFRQPFSNYNTTKSPASVNVGHIRKQHIDRLARMKKEYFILIGSVFMLSIVGQAHSLIACLRSGNFSSDRDH